MNKNYGSLVLKFCFMLLLSISNVFSFSEKELEVAKKEMIQNPIASYSGNCPCPYNVMRNGRACGKRSAYSRPGGATPLCYVSDISNAQAERYLKRK